MAVSRRTFVGAAVGMAAALQFPIRRAFGESGKPATLRAGAAIADITPGLDVNVDGVIQRSGASQGIHDKLHARSLALDDGTTRLTLTICDVRMIGRRICDEAKRIASERTGVPAANMLVAATHTHGTPTPIDLFDDEPYQRWQKAVIEGVANSITQAVKNLAPAKLGRASTRKPDYTFCRRWKLRDGATPPPNPYGGTDDKVLTNPGYARRELLLEPAGPVDDELSVISVRRASDDSPLALLANYSTHYVGGYDGARVSSDYYGAFGDRVKTILAPDDKADTPPFVAMMFNGTSGDTNTIDFSTKPDASPPWTRIAKVADDMANTAVDVAKSAELASDVRLAVASKEIELTVRKPDAARIAWAKSIQADPARNKGWPMMYARETLAMVDYPDRFKLLIQAMRIGDIAIAAMPCEVFASTGLEIKKQSPIQPTFNIGLANGYHGYLPTPEQHALGGYETWLARTSYLEVDASTKIRDGALEVLGQLK